jgi:FMN reductase
MIGTLRPVTAAVSILGVNCSPGSGGKTRAAIAAVLAGAAAAGADTLLVELADGEDLAAVVAGLSGHAGFVFGSPMYRATFATPFKALMDATPRGMHGEGSAPLTGRAAATVATAASDHHFLGPAGMRDILVDFFACHVVSPGLYAPAAAFDEQGALTEPFAGRAGLQGRALVELATAITASSALGAVTPNV